MVWSGDTRAAAKRANEIRTPTLSFCRSASRRNSPSIRRGGGANVCPPPALTVSSSMASTVPSTASSAELDDDPVTTPSTPLNPPQPAATPPALDPAAWSATAGDGWVRLPREAVSTDGGRAAGPVTTDGERLQSDSCCPQPLRSDSCCPQPHSSGQALDLAQDVAGGLEQESQDRPRWDLPRPSSRRPAIPDWPPSDVAIEPSGHRSGQLRPLEQGCAPAGADPDPCPFPAGYPPDGADGSESPVLLALKGRRQVCMEPEVTLISDIRLRT